LRGLLRGFGLKVGEISKGQFAARVRTLVAGHTMLERIPGWDEGAGPRST